MDITQYARSPHRRRNPTLSRYDLYDSDNLAAISFLGQMPSAYFVLLTDVNIETTYMLNNRVHNTVTKQGTFNRDNTNRFGFLLDIPVTEL